MLYGWAFQISRFVIIKTFKYHLITCWKTVNQNCYPKKIYENEVDVFRSIGNWLRSFIKNCIKFELWIIKKPVFIKLDIKLNFFTFMFLVNKIIFFTEEMNLASNKIFLPQEDFSRDKRIIFLMSNLRGLYTGKKIFFSMEPFIYMYK